MDVAMPAQFTDKTKWIDWYPSFLSFLRTISGRSGVPLNYIVRPKDVTQIENYDDFLDEYVDCVSLQGNAFISDATEVHTYIVKFIAGNDTAESKILDIMNQKNGRSDFISLKEHYEGVGINAVDAIRADKTIKSLMYLGEKRPYMYWEKFKKELTYAFNVYDKQEGRMVYSSNMKMRILLDKINVDFLSQTKTSVETELAKTLCTLSYDNALKLFRNKVNSKFPLQFNESGNGRRRIQAANLRYHGNAGRGYNRGGHNQGCGRFGRGGCTQGLKNI